jgi:hypothetical protein
MEGGELHSSNLEEMVKHDIIITAGRDREDRYIIVVNGCNFPNHKECDYDMLFE